jgi:acetyl esterase
VHDALAALKWADERHAAPNGLPLLVAGDSAGGNLAAVVARRAQAASSPDLQGQILISPILTADQIFPSQTDTECEVLIGRKDMTWFWDHYAPEPEVRRSIDAAPLSAPDFVGLPPTLIISGDLELSRDEAQEYGRKLSQAGVPVSFCRHEGEFHAFAVFGALQSSDEAIFEVSQFLDSSIK